MLHRAWTRSPARLCITSTKIGLSVWYEDDVRGAVVFGTSSVPNLFRGLVGSWAQTLVTIANEQLCEKTLCLVMFQQHRELLEFGALQSLHL